MTLYFPVCREIENTSVAEWLEPSTFNHMTLIPRVVILNLGYLGCENIWGSLMASLGMS